MSDETDKKLASCLGVIVMAVVMVVYGTVVGGLVLAVLWRWFMVPIFHLPELTMVQAVGVGYVVSYMTTRVDMDKKDGDKTVGHRLLECAGTITGKAIVFLAFGYIIKSLM